MLVRRFTLSYALNMLNLLIVEDNERLRPALTKGLAANNELTILAGFPTGEEAVEFCFGETPDVILMDVELAGPLNGIETAVAIRREHPRLPIVFYSIQDDDAYYRAFLRSGILSHYAYVRKSNYLLPEMIVPLLKDAHAGRSFIDADIEVRVQEVRQKDEQDPMSLLEPHEQEVAHMLAAGMSNAHIAQRLGFRDKRTVSRINGQIYTAWGLNSTTTDEKVARTRASIIMNIGRLLTWDADGVAYAYDQDGELVKWES